MEIKQAEVENQRVQQIDCLFLLFNRDRHLFIASVKITRWQLNRPKFWGKAIGQKN
jgi:hypothetical protein